MNVEKNISLGITTQSEYDKKLDELIAGLQARRAENKIAGIALLTFDNEGENMGMMLGDLSTLIQLLRELMLAAFKAQLEQAILLNTDTKNPH
jgi:GTPase